MDYIGATPQSNPIMGLLAERLKQAQQFATRPFGYQNPPAEMLLNLLGVPAVQQTAERLAYGEPLTTGRGMTTQIRPEVAEAALTVAPVAGLLGKATKGLPVGASIKSVDDFAEMASKGKSFKVTSQDASEIFGEGAKRIRYQEPNSQGFIDVLQKPDGTASVLGLEVPETARGKGIGQSLQAQVLSDFPEMQGQVSSKAAATTAYRLGRRPVGMPNASLEDVFKMIDEDSSVNLVSPNMQNRFGGLLGQPKAAEATDLLSYRGSHSAPGPDFGAPLYDLTGGGQMYPADVYSPKAVQYYGAGEAYDQKAFNIAQSFKDKPNATVTIYRAVPNEMSNSEKLADIEKQMAAYMKRGTLPKDAENFSSGSKWYDWAYDQREALRNMPDEPKTEIGINSGDWVTLTKEYAKDHGESALKGQYKILSKKVKAKDIWTNADSIHEFGYHPSE